MSISPEKSYSSLNTSSSLDLSAYGIGNKVNLIEGQFWI